MANWSYTSGRYGGGSNGPWLQLYVEEREKDIPNNRTKLYMRLRFYWDRSINYSFNNRSGSLYGTSYNYSGSASGSSGFRELRSQEVWVGHNSDGTKSVGITGNITSLGLNWSGVNIGTMSVSGTPTLTAIPRKTTLTKLTMDGDLINDRDIGFYLTADTKYTGYYHWLGIYDGNSKIWDSGYFLGGVQGSYGANAVIVNKFTREHINTMLRAMSNVINKQFTARLWTYSGNNGVGLIGTDSINFTATASSYVIPSLSDVTYEQIGNNITNQTLQSISRIAASFTPSAGYGSTISSSSITIAKGSDSQIINSRSGTTSRAVNQSGTYIITYATTDSRGRTNSTTRTLIVTAYSTPKITDFKVVRDMINQAKVNILEKGTWTPLGNSNILTINIQYRKDVNDSWNNILGDRSFTGGTFENSYSPINLFDVTQSYQFRLIIIDSFGNQLISTINISTQKVLMDWHKDEGVGIGKLHEQGTMDVAGPFYIDDVELDFIIDQGTTYRKWASGKLECWGDLRVNHAITATWGSSYCRDIGSATFAHSFVTGRTPFLNFNYMSEMGSLVSEVYLSSLTTATQTGLFSVMRPTPATSTAVGWISYYAIGRWK